jgi:hypothetical protein
LTNTTNAKRIRDKYDLRYSVLHFQIILVDQNNCAYPTDLQCQTLPIYDYEGKFFVRSKNRNLFIFISSATELKNLPPIVGGIRKQTGKGKKTKVVSLYLYICLINFLNNNFFFVSSIKAHSTKKYMATIKNNRS